MTHRCPLRRSAGFSLVEIAVVLLIVGLMLASVLLPLGAQIDQQNMNETQRRLEMARDALLGFAVSNRRLPCPATLTNSGVETTPSASGACSNVGADKFLPAVTLGLQPVDPGSKLLLDAWGHPIRYAVTDFELTFNSGGTAYTLRPFTYMDGMRLVYYGEPIGGVSGLALLAPDLRVCSAAACTAPTVLITNAVAVVFSTGKNTTTGGTQTDEAANLNGDSSFVSHTPSSSDATGGEFDDMLLWLSPYTLYNRMIVGGALP